MGETKNLNKAVRRNLDRFPEDFMFQLTLDEAQACAASRFQFGTLKRGQNIKYLPQVFTQEGFGLFREPTLWHSARHDLRTVAGRMEGMARADAAGTVPAQRGTVRAIPGDGRQP